MHINERQFKSEMLSQKKLSELYEDKLSQNEQAILQYQNLVKDLEGKLEAFAVERSQIIAQSEVNLKELHDELCRKNSEIEKLKTELENINHNFTGEVQTFQNGVCLNSLMISLGF